MRQWTPLRTSSSQQARDSSSCDARRAATALPRSHRRRFIEASAASLAGDANQLLREAAAAHGDRQLEMLFLEQHDKTTRHFFPAVRAATSPPKHRRRSPPKRRSATAVHKKRRALCGDANPRISPGLSVQQRVARAITQKRQMERLAMLPEAGLMGTSNARRRSVFVCSDAVKIPYEIMGEPTLDVTSMSIVVAHDLFDTLDATKIFFRRLVQRHQGCQVLVYNYAGQAGSSFASDADLARGLDAITHARHLNELLKYVDQKGDMLLATTPYLLAGIGFGFQIVAQLAMMFYDDDDRRVDARFRSKLRGLVSVNGFVHVDPQLAAALRAALLAFEAFPPDRPDLPVSYLSRFLFSDDYLAQVHPRLALNIYTAVSNTITLAGRIALIKGLLNDPSTSVPSNLAIPLIALQSTQDALVSPSQVDSLLKRHRVRHVWSHELAKETKDNGTALGARGRALLRETLWKEQSRERNAACVVWVKAGHEVRQEAPKVVEDVFDTIVPHVDFDESDDTYEPTGASRSGPRAPPTAAPDEITYHYAAPAPSTQSVREPETAAANAAEAPCAADASRPSAIALMGTIALSISLARMLPEDLTESVRAALVNDLASALTRLGTVTVIAQNVHIQPVQSGTDVIHLKVVDMSPDDANALGTTLEAKVNEPILPAYWADHQLTAVKARREVRTKAPTQPVDEAIRREPDDCSTVGAPAAESVTVGDSPPDKSDATTSQTENELLISTAAQRRARHYVEHVDAAHDAIVSRLEVDEQTGQGSQARLQQRYGNLEREAHVDAADSEMVQSGLVPGFEPPKGEPAPVVRPLPLEYKECAIPKSILRRNDVDRILGEQKRASPASAPTQPSASAPPERDEEEAQNIKREMTAALLVRESSLLAMLASSSPCSDESSTPGCSKAACASCRDTASSSPGK